MRSTKKRTKWSKELPKSEGWWWAKFRCGNAVLKRPAFVTHLADGTNMVRSGTSVWIEGPNHGGPGLKKQDIGRFSKDRSLHFGPKIPEP